VSATPAAAYDVTGNNPDKVACMTPTRERREGFGEYVAALTDGGLVPEPVLGAAEYLV
jgi:hypothetical protein